MDPLDVLVATARPERSRRLAEPLRAAGHQVAEESDPGRIVRGLTERAPDAVLVDLSHPGVDQESLRRAFSPPSITIPPESLAQMERRHILTALRYTGWNKRRAAHLLGIARSTLIQKVRKHGLEPSPDAH